MLLWAVDIQDQKDLGVLLEDTTIESGLNETWGNIRNIVVRYTKRGKWLANEEKRISDPTSKPKAGSEEQQPRAREITVEKGIDASTMEQLLKINGKSEDRDGEEVGRPLRKFQVHGPSVYMV
jgi:hypothetical protein